jgi:putative endonuclease
MYYVYILTNKNNNVLYTGITNNLIKRVYQHKSKMKNGFTKKYNVDRLVYFEYTENVYEAIRREKNIKGGSRSKKIELVNKMNPKWIDLYYEL